MVAGSTIIAMTVNMMLGLLLPALLYFLMKGKFGHHRTAFFTGCGVMFLFAFVLESAVHQIVLGGAFGESIQSNIWLYAVYGASMAALFEETGRLAAFKLVLKKNHEDDSNALFYGAGHGGFEAFYILFVSGINNLTFAALINSGQTAMLTAGMEGAALEQINGVIEQMLTVSWTTFLLSPVERIAAVILQISLSVLVWFAVKKKDYKFYGTALLFHFLMDFAAVVVNSYLSQFGFAGTVIVEVVVWIMAVISAVYAGTVWKKNHD